MSKKIRFGTKPQSEGPNNLSMADQWVKSRQTDNLETMKRLTIDIPVHLHARIKSQCALRNTKMADELRNLLEEKFPPTN